MEITAFHKYIMLLFIILMTINSELILGKNIINNLHGFLGIYEIPYSLGLAFTAFVYLAVINAVNLMDGIDSYLAVFCSLVCCLFGVIFLNLTGLATNLSLNRLRLKYVFLKQVQKDIFLILHHLSSKSFPSNLVFI